MIGVGGCNLDWEKPDPSTPPPDRFRTVRPRSASPLRGARDFAARFGSKELTELVQEALDKNLDVAAAAARIKTADAQARLSSASSWPSVSINNIAQTNRTPGTVLVPTSGASGLTPASSDVASTSNFQAISFGFFQLGLTASYEIDFWGKNADRSNAARLLANASRFDRDVVEIATVASVLNVYFQALAARDRLSVAHDNVRLASRVLETIKLRLNVGTATALDFTQQEALLAEQRATIPVIEQDKRQAENLLALLLGRAPTDLEVRGGTLAKLAVPAVAPGLPSEVLLRRPDVAQVEAKLASQEFSVLQARAAFFPSITLTGTYGLQTALLKNLLRPEAVAWQAATNLAQPLLDGYALQGQYDLQKSKYEELATLYQKQILSALTDVENALTAVYETDRRVKLQTTAVVAWRRAYGTAYARLREGTIDSVALATTQSSLFQSQDRLAQARLDRFRAIASLYQALGGGWSSSTREIEIAEANEAYERDKGPWP
jgi:multidrug efflux system outer membrane protein